MTAEQVRKRVRRKRFVREEGNCPDKDNSLTSAQISDVRSKDRMTVFVRARARARTNTEPLAAVEGSGLAPILRSLRLRTRA